MAFVYKSEAERNQTPYNSTGDIGPGAYIPLAQEISDHKNAKPFNSGSERSKPKVSDCIGPGAYYQDETLITYLKNVQNQKIAEQNDKVHLMAKGLSIELLPNVEKLGFTTKTKRFKNLTSCDVPGPGIYFPNIKEVNKVAKLRNQELYSKARIKAIKKSGLMRIPTIPSKECQFGFEILEDGNIMMKTNPDFYKTFTGEKGDTVGPGSYEVDKPNNWLKTGTEWSKFKAKRTDYTDKNKDNKEIKDKENEEGSLHSTHYTENGSKAGGLDKKFINTKTRYYIKDGANSERSNTNTMNKTNTKLGENETTMDNIRNSIQKGLNEKNIMRCCITYCKNNNNKRKAKAMTIEKAFANVTPGPGYYYDQIKGSSFKNKITPEYKQFFGSKLERFYKNEVFKNPTGPGDYFKNIFTNYSKNCFGKYHSTNTTEIGINLNNNSNDKNKNRNSIGNNINGNGNNQQEFFNKTCTDYAPFTSKTERFKKLLSEVYAGNEPSPATYNIQGFAEKFRTTSTGKFLSTQKRFAGNTNEKWRNVVPGPGSYDCVDLKKHHFTFTNNLYRGHIYSPSNKCAYTMIDKINEGAKDKEIKDKYTTEKPKKVAPPVGLYNPDIIFTIDYNNKRKVFDNRNGTKIAFNTTIPKKTRYNSVVGSEKWGKDNLGPGYYYKEQKVKNMQINPPFSQADATRKIDMKVDIKGVAPGMYNLDNYYDWNKKSFNVNFA